MTHNDILIFFYVDNIVFAHQRKDQSLVQQIVKSLKLKFKLSENDSLQWFLEIKIIQDREKKLIWLS